MLTIVHASDVHLETIFTEARGGNGRRAALADAFVRIIDLAIERNADVLTIGGDLYEAERAGPQTARFLFEQFRRFGKPVFIAPGNHDPYSARSLYARDDVPANVRVFGEPAWTAFPLADDVTLYGFGHTPAEPGAPFAGARFERGGVRIALVHGSDRDRCPPKKRPTAPFNLDEITASGATLVLTGHYHGGYVIEDAGKPLVAYPGSPEPIKFGENDRHGALVVTIDGSRIEVEAVPTARTRLIDLDVRVDGATNDVAVGAALEAGLAPFGANDYLRVRLSGSIERGTRIDRDLLSERFGAHVGALDLIDDTVAADYAAIAREPNVRGHVVADLLERAASDAVAQRALAYAVAAFEGIDIAP